MASKMNFENNLTNIRVVDTVYRIYQNDIVSYAKKMIPDQYIEIPQLKIGTTDSFFIHYSYAPLLRTSPNPDPVLETFRKVFAEYMNSDQFQKLHSITALNDDISKAYSIALLKKLVELLAKNPETQQMLQQLQQQMQQQQGGGQGQQSQQSQQQQQLQENQQGNQQNQQGQQQMQVSGQSQQLSNTALQAFEKALKEAMQYAEETAKNYKDLRDVAGREAGKEPGTFEKLLNLADQLPDTKLRAVIELYGKIDMPKFTKVIKEKGKHGDEVYGYRLTRNPTEAIAREFALPDELFYAKVMNGFIAREKATSKEGSIYVLIDKSGSMGGEKTVWARAVALALYRLAQQKKRKYFLRFFDTNIYPKNPLSDPITVVEHILSVESSGGTSIDTALRVAIDDIANNKLSEKTNTIVLITDGEDDVRIKPEELKKHNIELISIMIQGDNKALKKLSRQYLNAKLNENGALEVVEAVKG